MKLLVGSLVLVCVGAACNAITGLNDLSIGEQRDSSAGATGGKGGSAGTSNQSDASDAGVVGDCMTNRECTERFTQAPGDAGKLDGGVVPAVCVKPERRCTALLSKECQYVTGDYTADNAILLGSLFSTTGAQATTNLQRQQSATLAIEEINRAGGIPFGATAASSRPLVMISCDEVADLMAATTHLVNDLHVPAIVGPNTSQDTLEASAKVTVPAGTVLMTPTAVASSIAALRDNDLTWLMVPSDVQRAPLMIQQINEIEAALKVAEPAKTTVKLGIVYRDDALGIGTRTSLNTMQLNGKPLSDSINLGRNVRIDAYNFTAADQQAIVDAYVAFAPDIVVMAGTAEAITKIMVPLESSTGWSRPQYVLIDSVKVPELLTAVTPPEGAKEDLRKRIRGTGITPGAASAPVYTGFKVEYQTRYAVGSATTSGMGPAYDAAYAIAYALAATKELPVSGENIAKGLRKLAGGATTINVGSTNTLLAFQKLAAGENITAIGTFGPLSWDPDGAPVAGTLEMWCIGAPLAKPAYQSSGLTFDVKGQAFSNAYVQCTQ